jgi:hypothetical protein
MRFFVNGMKTSSEPFERDREKYREKNENLFQGKTDAIQSKTQHGEDTETGTKAIQMQHDYHAHLRHDASRILSVYG